MESGLSAVASTKGTLGKQQMTSLSLGTPLVLAAEAGRTFLSAGTKKAREAFSWAEIYPFDVSSFSPNFAEIPNKTASVMAIVPCAVPTGDKPELSVSVYIVDTLSGARSTIPIVRSDSVTKGPLEILTLELGTSDIMPGSYYLHINAQNRTTGALGHTATSFVVTPN
jgi:hypothetical protein